ncbi:MULTISPECIES: dihydrofolate reductase family protein [unclassified Synechococcus]|uniref:RibD family protein n=1 Tax=unclassified Synechococcus TaxID=2626047 RepID=UPI001CF860F8|nr:MULTISPECIES: dihydrofolate reductase family protein [unclassified Synechococcus]MCB4378796.1 dihydrofolate reductase family protein [Synechococcus sp. MU1650]MCB4411101.1 dihydrofolate reductase family protein [Synechococcus sp. MU1611]
MTPQRPTSQCPTVRLVLAISLDGRLAPPQGGAAQLGGAGDRRALEQALAWADACLIGAGTLRAHQCTCLIRNPQLLEQRLQEGRPQQPAAVVVSRSLGFSRTWQFFDQPLQRWLLAPAPMHQGFDRWFPLAPTWPERLQALGAAGIQRLVLLGGAQLTADLLAADCVDALQLTVVPQLLGGPFSWLPLTDSPLPASLVQPGAWQSDGVEDLGHGEWLLRYERIR